ncbi:septation ring formation regulator EzrA [Bacillus massilinigeriensis]|uniref:septation ring formation regulator EzrA n=1 Tax=Bacillus mediterraneensis TaxID=1805474 RepID=UPI0008F8751F|nr:septation ring formation regulator EzrA [Bacillus mediterraneensis]
MEFIIGGIILLMGFFLTGYILKRKYYNEVDKYEAWKLDIMNRPVLDEMSKVKQLNMTGQTEDLFERWRREWDEVVTVGLPAIEELLFDAEEYTDKLRFNKAKETFSVIENKLNEIEEVIDNILKELNELIGSEEKNRNEIEGLKETYRECRKNLLAHRHSFGKAEEMLEHQLDDVNAKFTDFEEKTENGNYLEAREVVLSIAALLQQINGVMIGIPGLLHECQSVIPSQISDLKDGFKEMAGQGYQLEHIGFEEQIAEMEKALGEYQQMIDEGDIAKVEVGISELKAAMETLFDLFEQEVTAKHSLARIKPDLEQVMAEAAEEQDHIQAELETIQESYHLQENDLGAQRTMDHLLQDLLKRFERLSGKISQGEIAQSFLYEEMLELKEEMEELRSKQGEFQNKLSALRKDELAARSQVKELSKEITEMVRLVTKSNLPGLSQKYKELLQDAKSTIENASEKLEQKPLDIPVVQQHLEIAVLTVEKLSATTKETIENAMLTEKVIQYGNRYRSKYPSVSVGLQEAEGLFRNCEYAEALEKAAAVIEEVEPGAMRKIEEYIYE